MFLKRDRTFPDRQARRDPGVIVFINSPVPVSADAAPRITGLLHDATGGYRVPVSIIGVVVLAGAALRPAAGDRKPVPHGASATPNNVIRQ
jgi:hypothetical protein